MHGKTDGHNVKQVKSIAFWGLAVPAAIVFFSLLGAIVPFVGLVALVLSLGYLVLGFKVWRYRTGTGDPAKESAIYAFFTVLGKFPNAIGACTYWKNHAMGKQAKIIEYKNAEGSPA